MKQHTSNSGDLDTSFGNGGYVIQRFKDGFRAVPLLLPDGKILSVGTAGRSDPLIITRHMPDGTLDPTFGDSGIVTTSLDVGPIYSVMGVVLQHDGKIVLGAELGDPDGITILMFVRLTQDGLLDTRFGNNGIVLIDLNLSAEDTLKEIAVQPDGKIVALARAFYGFNNQDSMMLRLDSAGALDPTFGAGGMSYEFPSSSTLFRLITQPDGKFLLSGARRAEAMLSRYDNNGMPDRSFGEDGHVYFDLTEQGDFAEVGGIALQNDGNIVVVGNVGGMGTQAAWIARVEANGQLDVSFNGGTPLVTKLGPAGNGDRAVAIQIDGKIVSLGNTYGTSADSRVTLMRFLSDGTRDTGFGVNGIVQTPPVGWFDVLTRLRIQRDRKILVSGTTMDDEGTTLMITRYLG